MQTPGGAGTADTFLLSWLAWQPQHSLSPGWRSSRGSRYPIFSPHGWPGGLSHEAAAIRALAVKLILAHHTKARNQASTSWRACAVQQMSSAVKSHYLQIWGERAWTCHRAYLLLPYSKLSLKKHFTTLGESTRQKVCYSSVSGRGDCNKQGAPQLLHPQAQYVSVLSARNFQPPNMEGRCFPEVLFQFWIFMDWVHAYESVPGSWPFDVHSF